MRANGAPPMTSAAHCGAISSSTTFCTSTPGRTRRSSARIGAAALSAATCSAPGSGWLTVAVEAEVAVEQPRAGLQLAGRHVRIEPGPGVDLALLQGYPAVGMLQVDDTQVVLVQAHAVQAAEQEQVGIGALGGSHLAPLEFGEAADRRILAHQQRGPLRAAGDVYGTYRAAVGPREYRGEAGGRGEIDAAGVEVLQGTVAALAEHPAHPGSAAVQAFLQPAELPERQAGGGVVGIVETDFSGGVGGFGRGKHGKNGEQGQPGPAATESGDHASAPGRRWMSEPSPRLAGKSEPVSETDGG